MNKKMQRIKPLLVLFLLMFSLISVDSVAKATEYSVKTPVSYTPGEMAGWSELELELSVKGGGTAKDGNSQIRDGVLTYTLAKGDEKTIRFLPDKGAKLVRLTLNGENALDNLSPQQELTVTMGEENQRVEAVFSDYQYQSVKTGDMANPLLWWTLSLNILLVILLVLMERKRQREKTS